MYEAKVEFGLVLDQDISIKVSFIIILFLRFSMRIWALRSPFKPYFWKILGWLFKILPLGFPRHLLAQTYVKQKKQNNETE